MTWPFYDENVTPAESAVLQVLADNSGKVVSRATLLRLSGLQHCAPRRCDGIMTSLRRVLGDNAIVTVRGRGWMLNDEFMSQVVATLSQFAA